VHAVCPGRQARPARARAGRVAARQERVAVEAEHGRPRALADQHTRLHRQVLPAHLHARPRQARPARPRALLSREPFCCGLNGPTHPQTRGWSGAAPCARPGPGGARPGQAVASRPARSGGAGVRRRGRGQDRRGGRWLPPARRAPSFAVGYAKRQPASASQQAAGPRPGQAQRAQTQPATPAHPLPPWAAALVLHRALYGQQRICPRRRNNFRPEQVAACKSSHYPLRS
jgi:hypothetical protein